MKRLILIIAVVGAGLATLGGCGGSGGSTSGSVTTPPPAGEPNVIPAFVKGPIVSTVYDGVSDDLLTAGAGRSGLVNRTTPPEIPAAAAVTPALLRRNAIINAYLELVDISQSGGFARLYGPNVDVDGVATLSEGKIAGEEHLAYADDGTGRKNVSMLVQVPATFDRGNPCLVVTASPEYRGVYAGIPLAGDWGLKHGCAVAYTDKGAGVGASDLDRNSSYSIQGIETTSPDATSHFTTGLTEAERTAYNAAFPKRWAIKQAHSGQNPEKDWGQHILQAAEFGLFVLNQKYGDNVNGTIMKRFVPSNTIVIAAGLGTAGGAILASAEQDAAGLIDGVVAAQPHALVDSSSVTVRRGGSVVPSAGRSPFDVLTLGRLYETCAQPAATGAASVNADTRAGVACASLQQRGLIVGSTAIGLSSDALARLHLAGWEPESHAMLDRVAREPHAVALANAYARASVKDNLCDYSIGSVGVFGSNFGPITGYFTTGLGTAYSLFGRDRGGLVPSGDLIVLTQSDGRFGLAPSRDAQSKSTGLVDGNLDGIQCLRALLTGADARAIALRAGIAETRRTANLRGRPGILVQGRADAALPPNHASRPYYAANRAVEGASRLVYIEVTNAQHADALLAPINGAGPDTRFVPLQRYFNQSMDLVWANIKSGVALPPSQVVRTIPRGGTPGVAPALTAANVPPIATTPAPGDVITFSNATLTVPD